MPQSLQNDRPLEGVAIKRASKSAVLAAAFAGSIVIAMPIPAETVTNVLLRTPVAFSTAFAGSGTSIKLIADGVDIASNGSIKMRPFEPDKRVVPFDTLNTVSSENVDPGYATVA